MCQTHNLNEKVQILSKRSWNSSVGLEYLIENQIVIGSSPIFNIFSLMMPQFDTFSFLSQETWVFSFFFLIYFSLRYSFLPAIAAILKVRKLHASESKSVANVSFQETGVTAFPEEVTSLPVSNSTILGYSSFTGIAPQISGVYYLHFSGSPLNVL